MDNQNKIIVVGKVLKAHGLRGQLKIESFCQDPKNIFNYKNIFNHKNDKVTLKLISQDNQYFLVAISNINNRNEAEKISGQELLINYHELDGVDQDNYYYSDLENCIIYDQANQATAKVVAMHNFGAGDLIEVKFLEKNNNEFIPFEAEYIIEVDIPNKRIVLNFELLGEY